MDTRELAKEYRLSHWAGLLQERKQSGVSVRNFCKESGIHENVYYYWQRKLRAAASGSFLGTSPALSSIAVVPQGWAACEEGPGNEMHGTVTIEIGKSRVRIAGDIGAEQLEKICRVLLRLC